MSQKSQIHAIQAAPLSQGWRDTRAGTELLRWEENPACRGHLAPLDRKHQTPSLCLQEEQEGTWLDTQAMAACFIFQPCGCVTLDKLTDLTEPKVPWFICRMEVPQSY